MSANDLVLWETAQTFLGIPDGEDNQVIVEHLITAASLYANNYCSRKLARRTYSGETEDEVYDGTGSRFLYLEQFPVASITAIYQDISRAWAADTEITSTSYTFYPERGKIVFDNYLFAGARTIKVGYVGGYVTIDTPQDLAQAILIIVDYWKKRVDDHGWGVSSVGVDDKRIAYQLGIPNQAIELLKLYRKSVVG